MSHFKRIAKYSIFTLFFLAFGCINAPKYPIEPVIKYGGMTRYTMKQGDFRTDSLSVIFTFTDGDGDLGMEDSMSIFLIDTRDNNDNIKYKIPFIPEAGASKGISGEVRFTLFSTCCIFQDPFVPPCTSNENEPLDTVVYKLFIRDRAGNISNEIELDPIVLDCK